MQSDKESLMHNIRQRIDAYNQYMLANDQERADGILQELQDQKMAMIKEKQEDESNTNDALITYPEVENPSFFSKIAQKKEFYKNMYPGIDYTDKTYDELYAKECLQERFTMTPNQIFLKNYISPHTPYKSILLFHGVGVGKCHRKDTEILMYDGSRKKVQDIVEGESLMGHDFGPRRVLNTVRGKGPMYRITLSDNTSFVVNDAHILPMTFENGSISIEMEQGRSNCYHVFYVDNEHNILCRKVFDHHCDATLFAQKVRTWRCDILMSVQQMRREVPEILYPRFRFVRMKCPIGFNYLEGKSDEKDAFELGRKLVKVCGYKSQSFPDMSDILNACMRIRQKFLAGFFYSWLVQENNTLSLCDISFDETLCNIARSVGFFVNVNNDAQTFKCQDITQEKQEERDPIVIFIDLYHARFCNAYDSITYHLKDIQQISKEEDYYGFSVDKDSMYLMGDFLLTHNSRTSIGIAEQYHKVFKKPVLVLMPTNLKDNFKKQLHDALKMQMPRESDANISRFIHQNYEFMGFLKFAKSVDDMEEKIKQRYQNKERQRIAFQQRMTQKFSNRVIIMDEVHNTRAEKNDPNKKAPKRIIEMLRFAQNTVLVMLSATPMFNGTKEIIWILNYILAHEKKPLVDVQQVFDDQGDLTENGHTILVKNLQGYVSYMRGENPFSFPFLLYPSVNEDQRLLEKVYKPRKNIKNVSIPKPKQLRMLLDKIVVSRMSPYQSSAVAAQWQKSDGKMEAQDDDTDMENVVSSIDDDNSEENTDQKKAKKKPIVIPQLLQLSNIAYPHKDAERIMDSGQVQKLVGKAGFDRCFQKRDEKVGGKKRVRFAYRKGYQNFLSPENIGQYSAKIKDIIDYIQNSEGIVYIYSFFVYSALIPLAFALEHMGYERSDGTRLLDLEKGDIKKASKKPLRYTFLTRHPDFYTDFGAEIKKITSPSNKDGQNVKVILGTSVSAEGLDLKNIRQLHIVEPWFHLNRMGQVIGRAVRKCSHKDLPVEKRNVTVYQHASVSPSNVKNKSESIDLHIYHIAERKQITIDRIEKVLMEHSVDCILNKNILTYPVDKVQMKLDQLKTSQGRVIQNYPVGDDPSSYKYARVKCAGGNPENIDPSQIDEKTFSPHYYDEEIQALKKDVKDLYRSESHYTFSRLLRKLRENTKSKVDEDIVKFTLTEMIETHEEMMNGNGERGILKYLGKYYVFQPAAAPHAFISLHDRQAYRAPFLTDVVIDDQKARDNQMRRETNGDADVLEEDVVNNNQKNTKQQMLQVVADGNQIDMLFEHAHGLLDTSVGHMDLEDNLVRAAVDYHVDRLQEHIYVALIQEVLTARHAAKKNVPQKVQTVFESLIQGHYVRSARDIMQDVPKHSYIVRNPSYMYTSLEFHDKGDIDKYNPYEQERALLFFDGSTNQVRKLSPFEWQMIMQSPRFKNTFSYLDNIDFDMLEGFMQYTFKNGEKDTVFKVTDLRKTTGVKCGTGKITEQDYKERIKEKDSNFLCEDVRYVKSKLCVVYEILMRFLYVSFLGQDISHLMFNRPIERYYIDQVVLRKNLKKSKKQKI